jgi:hypothetical protein
MGSIESYPAAMRVTRADQARAATGRFFGGMWTTWPIASRAASLML